MDSKKPLGNVATITVDIDGMIKLDNMAYNNINILVGQNGSGKSFILKLIWAVSYTVESFLNYTDSLDIKRLTQEVFDGTFTEQDFNGTIKLEFTSGVMVDIKLVDGQIEYSRVANYTDVEGGSIPIFMSTNTRLFTNIKMYLGIRKLLGIKGLMTLENDPQFKQLLGSYRLYDIVFIERFIGKCFERPYILSEEVQSSLKAFELRIEVESIEIDLELGDILYTNSEGSKKSLTSLSNGEQSLVNMIVNTHL